MLHKVHAVGGTGLNLPAAKGIIQLGKVQELLSVSLVLELTHRGRDRQNCLKRRSLSRKECSALENDKTKNRHSYV